jgi:hypothetical protein
MTGPVPSRPVALTIAGFDPGSGAGITADLKTFSAHGIYGVACISALTVQSTLGVPDPGSTDAGMPGRGCFLVWRQDRDVRELRRSP